MNTLSDALSAYRVFAQAEGKSLKTVRWITPNITYFSTCLGGGHQDIAAITAGDLRRFIIAMRDRQKFADDPFNKQQEAKISV